jgi:hypothetical protein
VSAATVVTFFDPSTDCDLGALLGEPDTSVVELGFLGFQRNIRPSNYPNTRRFVGITRQWNHSALLQKNVLDRQRWAAWEELRLAIIPGIERTYHRRRGPIKKVRQKPRQKSWQVISLNALREV